MSDTESLEINIFEEPEGYNKSPSEHHFTSYVRKSGKEPKDINLRLVGASPLWGHLLWNAGIFTADYIDEHPELVKGKDVLELGAAAALPSIVSGLNKARTVVSTDYPDVDLIENIKYNFEHTETLDTSRLIVEGYIWGNDYKPLLEKIRDEEYVNTEKKFDLIILSDLVFNHSEHHKLLRTCKDLLAKDGKCLVVFSPHRPWLLEEDLSFFETSKDYGFKPDRTTLVQWKPMFPEENPETAEIRARIYSYYLIFDDQN